MYALTGPLIYIPLTLVSIVISFVLQKILTHVNEVDQSGPVFCSCSYSTSFKGFELRIKVCKTSYMKHSSIPGYTKGQLS